MTLQLTGLLPETSYHYGIEVDGVFLPGAVGRLQTFDMGDKTFTFAFASCARTGSTNLVFDRIRQLDPLFFVHMGDFHYENIEDNNASRARQRLRAAYSMVFGSNAQASLYGSLPLAIAPL